MISETSRTITPAVAKVVADFEMFGRDLVTTDDVAMALGTGIENQVRNAIRTLVERGWLRPLVARGWYEFLPARGGPYPSGDPLVVARAVRRKRPDLRLAVVGTGAAFLRGFSERGPRRYVVAVDHAQGGSVAVAREYEVVKTTLARLEGIPEFGDVPVSDAAHLLADVALWPAACGDLRNGDHWLRRALAAAAPANAVAVADRVGPAAAARMAYLAARFEAPTISEAVAGTLRWRARTAIGPADAPVVARDPKLGVEDHVGVATLR